MSTVVIGAGLLAEGCGEDFSSCKTTRTCPGSGGSDGTDGGDGGASSGGAGGAGGATSSGGAGASGSGGRDGGSAGAAGDIDSSAPGDDTDGGGREGGAGDGGVEAGPGPLSITVVEIPAPVLNKPYTFAIPTKGGASAPAFRVSAGALPAGLTLSATGTVAGTPTAWGDFDATVEAKSGDEVVTVALRVRVITRLWLVYDNDVQKNGVFKKFAVNIGAGTPYTPTDLGDAGTQEAWSPDGNYVSYVTKTGNVPTVRFVDLTGLSAVKAATTWTGTAGCTPVTAWAPDSSRFAVTCGRKGNLLAPATPVDVKPLNFEDAPYEIVWSPDSKRLAAAGVRQGGEDVNYVSVGEVTSGTMRPIDLGYNFGERVFWSRTSDRLIVYGLRQAQPYKGFWFYDLRPSATASAHDLFPGTLYGDLSPLPVLFKTLNLIYAVGPLDIVDNVSAFSSDWSMDTPIKRRIMYPTRLNDGSGFMQADVEPYLANNETVRLFITLREATSGFYLVLEQAVDGDAGGSGGQQHAVTSKRHALSADTKDMLLPIAKDVLGTGSAADFYGALVRFSFGSQGSIELETLNTPTATTRQSDFGFARDAKAAFFLETASTGAPLKAFYVDLRGSVHQTSALDTGGTPFESSTAYSPSSTHLSTVVSPSSGVASLRVFDVRGTKPSAYVNVSGDGRVNHVTWQPTWP